MLLSLTLSSPDHSLITGSLQAKAIVVPTDDAEVKVRLRGLGEPTCEQEDAESERGHNISLSRFVWGGPC